MLDIQPMLGVIALPVLAPLAAILQLLFPGLMRDQWQRYQVAISVLMSQSTVLVLQWVLVTYVYTQRVWWLDDWAVSLLVVILALLGIAYAWLFNRPVMKDGEHLTVGEPYFVEYVALGVFILLGLVWMAYLAISGQSVFDQMTVATGACAAGYLHLLYRRGPGSETYLTTEIVMMAAMVLVGLAITWSLMPDADQLSGQKVQLATDWPTFRGNPERTGAGHRQSGPARQPHIAWTYDPRPGKGRLMFHSTPVVSDGYLFIGALRELQTVTKGYLYCLRAKSDLERSYGSTEFRETERLLWRFSAGDSAKPVFSSPAIIQGKLYFGEGYHQDRQCRLFCIDPLNPKEPVWSRLTSSHVESSPAVVGAKIFVGAGDDGVYCFDASKLSADKEGQSGPEVVWHVENIHIDAAPLVAEGRVFVGSVVGDIHAELAALAIDADKGNVLWRVPTALPVPGSPAIAGDRVFFGLGNGKMDHDADQPAGGILCLKAADGAKVWEFAAKGSVLNAAAVAGEHVICTSRDGHCYSLAQRNGEVHWKRDLKSPISAAPLVAGEFVYVVAVSGEVSCLKLVDGEVVWQLVVPSPDNDAFASPTAWEGQLYVAAGGKVYCLAEGEAP